MNKNYYKILKYIEENEPKERVVNINPILKDLYPDSCVNQSLYIKNDLTRLFEYKYIHKCPDFISSLDWEDAGVKRKLEDKKVEIELTEIGRNVIQQHETNLLTKESIKKQNIFNFILVVFTGVTFLFSIITAVKESVELKSLLQQEPTNKQKEQIHKLNVQIRKKILEKDSSKH